MREFWGRERADEKLELNARTDPTRYQWFDERVAEEAVDYLREQEQTDDDRPFPAAVGYILPHCPFIAPEEPSEYYYDRVDVEVFRRNREILDPPSAERIRIMRAAYFALCEYVDKLIGRVLEALERTGLADNTPVVYCSDHGEIVGEPGCWWKQNYYKGSVGIPLVARLPGEIEAGSVEDAVVNLMDLDPTFAEVAGTEFSTPVGGRFLWPLLAGDGSIKWGGPSNRTTRRRSTSRSPTTTRLIYSTRASSRDNLPGPP